MRYLYMTGNNITNGLDNLLKSYLGNDDAIFKDLVFYNANSQDPKDRITISQRDIISEIITCVANALAGNYYHDFFVTASTGSGKSMLFQLAAYYYSLIDTSVLIIVIEPLIALMHDQVEGIRRKGHTFAAYLDSTCTVNMRDRIINDLKNNNINLLYVSPEMFVAKGFDDIIGRRKIGLFVIDEAHTVTTWGRDFRPDYCFLTDHVQALRKEADFPVLCLTATAVYGGPNDAVLKTVDVFSLIDPLILLGIVRRDDIKFNYSVLPQGFLTHFIDDKEKTLVYFAYAKDARKTKDDLRRGGYEDNVGIYYGDLNKSRKDLELSKFRDSKTTIMLCTKAFGMGVDIPDIVNCYHSEPTGELEDYVQEIGRCARDPNIQGTAYYCYSDDDIEKVEFLHDVSFIRSGQIRYLLGRIRREINSTPKSSNDYKHEVLLSPEEFLFFDKRKDNEKSDPINKVKLCLLLISQVVNFGREKKRMIVYPNTVSTGCFVFVSSAKISSFETTYKKDSFELVKKDYNNCGNIYKLDVFKVWKDAAPDKSFSDFKQAFLDPDINPLVRYMEIKVVTDQPSLDVMIGKYRDYMDILRGTLINLQKKPFLYKDFELEFVDLCLKKFTYQNCNDADNEENKNVFPNGNSECTEESISDSEDTDIILPEIVSAAEIEETITSPYGDIAYLLFSLFLASDEEANKRKRKNYYPPKDAYTGYNLITKAKTNMGEEQKYKVMETDKKDFEALSFDIIMEFEDLIRDMFSGDWIKQETVTDVGVTEITTFEIYCVQNKSNSTIFALDILRILDLIYYRILGGLDPKISLTVYGRFSTFKTARVCEQLIRQENRRFRASIDFLDRFLKADLTSDQRWDVIENYFLGNMEAAGKILEGNATSQIATPDKDIE